jgi:hypothetical protein
MRARATAAILVLGLAAHGANAQSADPMPGGSDTTAPLPNSAPVDTPPAVSAPPADAPPTVEPSAPPTYSPPAFYEPPPPPTSPTPHGFHMPPWSIRVDPFNLLLDGRLGFELEAGVTSFISVELVPIFVVNSKPPTLNFSSIDNPVRQESNGLGALAGSSIDVGFWLSGHVLEGYVIRAMFQNYGYAYKTVDSGHDYDRLEHTDRVLMAMFGSNSRWGAFTIAGGLGLGVDLNHQERCFTDADAAAATPTTVPRPTGHGCGDLQLLDSSGNRFGVQGWAYPVVLDVRFSLGVSFD